MKLLSLARTPSGEDWREFQTWYLREHAPKVFDARGAASRFVVNLADWGSSNARGNADPKAIEEPVYPVVSEIWVDDAGAAAVIAEEQAVPGAPVLLQVTELVEKRTLPSAERGATPGLKVIGCVTPIAGQSIATFRGHWDDHVALALDIHVGMANYIRNWVERPLSEGAPAYQGIPMLHFASREDLEQRHFRDAEAKRLHALDTGQFVGAVDRMVAVEHVLGR